MTAAEYVMTISSNGQVSIPAAARPRWGTRKVVVVDLGDRVVMRPTVDSEDAAAELQGKYAPVDPTPVRPAAPLAARKTPRPGAAGDRS